MVVNGLIADQGKDTIAAGPKTIIAQTAAPEYREDLRREGQDGENESLIGELHAALANITLGLVLIQITGLEIAAGPRR
jgi:cytochrome b